MAEGVTGRMVAAWRDPAASFAAERPAGEPRLLAYAFGTCLFLTLGRIGMEVVRPGATDGLDGAAWLAAQVFVGFSFLPLALYGAAGLIGLISRALGGAASWSDTRLAFFWSGLVAGPVALIGQMLGAAAMSDTVGNAVAGLVWLIILCPMLAAAHRFRLSRVVMAFLTIVVIAFALRSFG